MSIYLDYNSSSPIDRRVLQRMISVYENYIGNADSRTHDFGNNARKIVEDARHSVANLLGIASDEVYFTSGATESNNIAIQGLIDYANRSDKKHIISSSIEHKSILNTLHYLETLGFEVEYINPDHSGRVSVQDVVERIKDNTLLVTLLHVNNETGIIQPIKELGDYLKTTEIFFHIDATQSFGKLVEDLQSTHYNMLSMSAHKISGPQGVGALILRKQGYRRLPVKGIMYGGQQEKGIRPGTIPVALVAGLGEACKIILQDKEYQGLEHCRQIKELILRKLQSYSIPYIINGDQKHCMPNTLNLCFPGVSSEALMLSSKQYCSISNGSACNSNSYEPSYVLRAMGISDDLIESSIRISWGSQSIIDDISESIDKLLQVVKRFV